MSFFIKSASRSKAILYASSGLIPAAVIDWVNNPLENGEVAFLRKTQICFPEGNSSEVSVLRSSLP